VRRALTGIKPSGTIHLGNWLGALAPAVGLQAEFATFYFVADLHALTSVTEAEPLRRACREVAASFLAFGLDPSRSVLFRQSAVPQVCELAWILGCAMPGGQLERGHAVKAAREGGLEVNVGTWYYPVLMAADILLYDAAVVPVGQDQKQHVEVARDLAIKLNHRYGEGTLVVPEVVIRDAVGTIPGLDGRKMSKSYGNQINLWEPAPRLRKQVMKMITDSLGVDEPKDPDTCAVFKVYQAVASPEESAALAARYRAGVMGYGEAKVALFEVLDRTLAGPRAQFEDWMAYPDRLDEVLADGASRARIAAATTMERVRARVGLS
jgi:tryptophanyl-tRNA synthetase